MSGQQRIYITLSPRMRRALELCATLDGSTPASYGAILLSTALMNEIERHPALQERWYELEREALQQGSWESLVIPSMEKSEDIPMKMPKGWLLAGSKPDEYAYGVDEDITYQGNVSGYLRSKSDVVSGFGTLMQKFQASEYRGKRLRFSAVVKAGEVEGWAGLWMRIDGAKGKMLGFDNMVNRAISGTRDWQQYEIVLDVPQESSHVAFGILLQGIGQVWLNNIHFTEVGTDVATTNIEETTAPINLDFSTR